MEDVCCVCVKRDIICVVVHLDSSQITTLEIFTTYSSYTTELLLRDPTDPIQMSEREREREREREQRLEPPPNQT